MFKGILIIAWIFLWIALATWMALGTLTSTQFHNELQRHNVEVKAEDEAAIPTILRLLERNLERFEILDGELQKLKRDLALQESAEAKLISDLEQIKSQIKNLEAKLKNIENREQLESEELSVGSLSGAFSPVPPTNLYNEERSYVIVRRTALVTEEVDKNNRHREALSERMKIETELKAKTKLFNEHLKDSERLDLVQQISTVKNFGFHFLFRLPRNLVVLLMALAMGALGSAVYITRHLIYYASKDPRPFSWYFMRPFLGMIMGLIMYLAANAGLFIFSDGNETVDGLNPFTISVLAVFSGMLAEQAYLRIQQMGERMLASSQEGEQELDKVGPMSTSGSSPGTEKEIS